MKELSAHFSTLISCEVGVLEEHKNHSMGLDFAMEQVLRKRWCFASPLQ